MWSFVGGKFAVVWVWAALDAGTRAVVAMVTGDRSERTATELFLALPVEYRDGGDLPDGLLAGVPGGAARRQARRVRQGGRADQPRRAILVHGAAATAPSSSARRCRSRSAR